MTPDLTKIAHLQSLLSTLAAADSTKPATVSAALAIVGGVTIGNKAADPNSAKDATLIIYTINQYVILCERALTQGNKANESGNFTT